MTEIERKWDREAVIAIASDSAFCWIATRTPASMEDVYWYE